MKNLNKITLYLAVLAASVFITSCSDEDVDNMKPTIKLVAPVDDQVLHPGSELHFECEFADDVELRSYKVEIHNNFDGHTHEHATVLKSAGEEHGHPWAYSKSWDFEAGQKNAAIHHHEIVVPQTILVDGVEEEVAEGNYHLGVYCMDAAGNESKVFVDIVIEHQEIQ